MEGWILGLHLLSAHLGDLDPGAHPRRFTPGIYAVAPSGVTAGAYRNSLDKDTVYLGWTWRSGYHVGPFTDVTFTAAAATGYSEAKVVPLLAVAATLGHGPYAPRVLWAPHRTQPVSLAIERRF
ncbi:MAG: hypothetical protein IPM15_03180 [Betaproteobacteria bacterium]|jgi:hypothetical protein|nr:hypothetical protein [Betaproteobacteria bacterium]MCC6249944.1 hypothetical protein [Rubrivivax sp.]MCL4695522.1 hypothetical protein [Burkholderiaceae bacterium]